MALASQHDGTTNHRILGQVEVVGGVLDVGQEEQVASGCQGEGGGVESEG